jgi:hypothetical protein
MVLNTRLQTHFASLLVILSLSLTANANTLPSDQYEQPRYQVVESIGPIEIRQYAAMVVAEVEVTGDRDQAARRGFRILANYIFGGNQANSSVAMTSPVTQVALDNPPKGAQIAMTSPVTQVPLEAGTGEPRWTFAFMMPARYTLETLPKPNNPDIRFRVREGELRATIRFDGFSSASNLQRHREQLLGFIRERQLQSVGEPVLALYDDPFTLPWNRRNEWWVALKG